MFRRKGNTGDCFLLFFQYSVIIPLNTSTGGLFSHFSLSSFCAISKFFLYFFRKVLFSLACITESGSSGQLLLRLLSHNEQDKTTSYWALLMPYPRQMFQLLWPSGSAAHTLSAVIWRTCPSKHLQHRSGARVPPSDSCCITNAVSEQKQLFAGDRKSPRFHCLAWCFSPSCLLPAVVVSVRMFPS